MKKLLAQLILLPFLTSCVYLNPDRVPGSASLISAACYIDQLKESGGLPGVDKNAEYTLRSVPTKAPDASAPDEPSQLVMMVSVTKNKNALYWFYMRKVNQGSNWEITAACRTDAKGKSPEWLPLHG